MEDKTQEQLRALLPALKSLKVSVERAVATWSYQGVGKMAVRTYKVLHAKIAELLPDDIYVTEALKLELGEDDVEQNQVAQVSLAANQLYTYLTNMVSPDDPWLRSEDLRDLKHMGRDLRDQIMTQTREALRRALSGLENVVPPAPPAPPAPPVPPTPPTPPSSVKRVVRIELGDDEPETGEKPKHDDII